LLTLFEDNDHNRVLSSSLALKVSGQGQRSRSFIWLTKQLKYITM